MADEKKPLGKILLTQKLVTRDELDSLLEVQRASPGERLASVAEEEGIDGERLLKALSEQHGLPGIDLAQVVIPLENLELIPLEIAEQQLILPILVKDDRIFLAMADPDDRRVIAEIEFVAGRRVFPYVALHHSLKTTIAEAYARAELGKKHFVGSAVPRSYLESLGLGPRSERPPASIPEPPSRPAASTAKKLTSDDDLGLPQAPPPLSELPQAVPEPKTVDASSIQILVVDDESDIRRLLARVLRQKGYSVIEAERGNEALEKVRDEKVDLILLDAMLPEVHGFEICRRIKSSEKYSHIPVVMVSAVYRGWRVAEDLRSSYGVDAFLEKPFKISDVLALVERTLAGTPEAAQTRELGEEATQILEQGIALYEDGNLDAAIAKLREGVILDPLSFQLHYHLGLLSGRKGEVFDAIQSLETAVHLQPREYAALKNLAVLYERAGFRHKATEMWQRALALAPEEKKPAIREHLMTLL